MLLMQLFHLRQKESHLPVGKLLKYSLLMTAAEGCSYYNAKTHQQRESENM